MMKTIIPDLTDSEQTPTKAINAAIEAAYSAGGGRVLLPTGRHSIGTIFLKSNSS